MISERVEKLVTRFNKNSDWEDRYKHIIEMGKSLPVMEEEYKIEANKVNGCQSQVWLHAIFKDGKIVFLADSDASITKGIISMLLEVYSGSTPDEILSTPLTFLDQIGIKEHLSMSRANGLSSMVKKITIYAMAFKAKQSAAKT